VRKTNGKCNIWGKPAKYIEASYISTDGKVHTSLLLCCGFWGWSRHFNYVGDILFATAMCLSCWAMMIVPFFYLFMLSAILIHRIIRDHNRCKGKYGIFWDKYC
jgi:7-dehydrocholesterol reductase